ncbi:a-factor receptor [Ceratobasidium sp. 394]|nr:a-factor receptor [Ceratobasidium sp. 394]KAG9092749.1 a-factor receptor [Ceratobasidium sp. UAMH 11750]
MARSWAFTACCGLSILLVLLPSPWHWKAKNTGTLLYIGWTVTGNLVFMINSIIWAGNIRDPAPVWCDISSRIIIAMSIGLTASALCINRRLYSIATIQSVSVDQAVRRRRTVIDLLLGILFPIVVTIMSYIVQDHRYDIFEDLGCWPVTYPTLLAVPLVMMWPIIIGTSSFIYASLSIRAFIKIRHQFNQVLSDSNTGINMSRYLRMMGLASIEMLLTIPLSIYILYLDLTTPQIPWVSWEYTHYKFSRVYRYPTAYTKRFPLVYRVLMLNQWLLPVGGFLFFLWFGLAGEAIHEYKRLFFMLVSPFGIKSKPKSEPLVPQAEWTNKLASTCSSNDRDRVRYPSLPDLNNMEIAEEKTNSGVGASGSIA